MRKRESWRGARPERRAGCVMIPRSRLVVALDFSVGPASAGRDAAGPLWVGLQPDGLCAEERKGFGLKADPHGADVVGRASARPGSWRERKGVGLKADPQGEEGSCGSGFSPTGFAAPGFVGLKADPQPLVSPCGSAFRPTPFTATLARADVRFDALTARSVAGKMLRGTIRHRRTKHATRTRAIATSCNNLRRSNGCKARCGQRCWPRPA